MPPAAGPAGVVNVNESGVRLVTVTPVPLIVALVPVAKSEPATVTSWPPPAGPEAGVSDAIDGAANVYRPMKVFQHVFAVVHGATVFPSLSSETTHTSVGCAASCTAPE